MNTDIYIGIDPGTSGALAVIELGCISHVLSFEKVTERDIIETLTDLVNEYGDTFAALESVHAMPKQGVSSTFKFGKAYGFIRGVLLAVGIPFEDVTPQTWQRELKCLTKGDKNVSKAKAQQLFPGVKVTNKTADSVCLAEYARRLWHQRYGSPTAAWPGAER